jgi:tight adherence protein B
MTPTAAAAALVLLTILILRPPRTQGTHRLTAATSARPTPPRPAPVSAPGWTSGVVERRQVLSTGRADLARTVSKRLGLLTVAVVIAVLLASSLGMQVLVVVAALSAIAWTVLWQRSHHRRRSAGAALRAQIIEACDVLSADLTAGRPPAEALEGAATICSDLKIASAACRLGGDVPATLDLAAESPGAEGLRALASAWRVAEESGAAFAGIVDRLSDSLRADEAIRRQTAASLAGARSTARLLAVLPFFGAALGYALGADPIAFLTDTKIGWIALAAGLALSIAGLAWTDRLAEDKGL